MSQVGIPLFYLQELAGAQLRFKDNFADSEKYWAWRLFLGELSEVGKTGVEENGYFELSVAQDINGHWDTDDNEAPRLFIGALSCPCEVKTRLDVFSDNLDNAAGIFISKAPCMFGTDLFYSFTRLHTVAEDGIAVLGPTVKAYVAITTLPVWLRIRIGCGSHQSYTLYFDYSHDGVNWTNLYALDTGWAYLNLSSPGVGLLVNNYTSNNAVSGRFDFFQMKPKSPN